MRGVKRSTPSASPAHQATPARTTRSDSISWACASAATPIAAAITGVPSAAGKIRRRTSRTRASAGSNRSDSSAPGRANSHAAATAASVAPSAITVAVNGGDPSERLARNAPIAMPGKSRKPPRTSAATATPDAGQTSETFEPKSANTSPSFAVPKYAAARTRLAATSRQAAGIAGRTSRAFVLMRRGDLEHLLEGRRAGGDLHRAADAQRLHAVLVGLVADLAEVRGSADQPLDRRREQHHLVDPAPPPEPGHAALEAADRLVDPRRPPRLPRPHQLLPGDVVRAVLAVGHLVLAVRAERADEPLRHHREHG